MYNKKDKNKEHKRVLWLSCGECMLWLSCVMLLFGLLFIVIAKQPKVFIHHNQLKLLHEEQSCSYTVQD